MPSGSQSRLTNDTPTSCRPAFTGDAHLEMRVGGVHVLFELRIALRVAREVLRRRHPLRFAADGEPLQAHAVETEVELVPLAHADDVVVLLAAQQDFDRVLGVERKVIANERAALRAERQVVADPLVLHQRLGDLERVDTGWQRGIADRQAADRPRGRQVVLQQRRRDRQHARHVVEAFLIGFVRRQQRAAIDLQPEQVANRVRCIRCGSGGEPARGPGVASRPPPHRAARSSADATARYVAASGRGRPGGGISPVRSLVTIFSHCGALAAT